MSKKAMISQPMRGKTNEQIRVERKRAVELLESWGYEVIDTVLDIDEPPLMNPGIYFLAKSIDFMSQVDTVFFMEGWESARGCKIEHEIAVAYGLRVLHEV